LIVTNPKPLMGIFGPFVIGYGVRHGLFFHYSSVPKVKLSNLKGLPEGNLPSTHGEPQHPQPERYMVIPASVKAFSMMLLTCSLLPIWGSGFVDLSWVVLMKVCAASKSVARRYA